MVAAQANTWEIRAAEREILLLVIANLLTSLPSPYWNGVCQSREQSCLG